MELQNSAKEGELLTDFFALFHTGPITDSNEQKLVFFFRFFFSQEAGLLLLLFLDVSDFLIPLSRRQQRQQPTSPDACAGLVVGVDVLVGVKGTRRRPVGGRRGGSEDPAQVHSAHQ